VGYAADEWWRVVPHLRLVGILSAIDTIPLAAYCVAYARWRTAEEALARMGAGSPLTGGLGWSGPRRARGAIP
jgi:phage terminase small subunit